MAKGLTDLQSQEPIVDPLTGQASPYFLRYLLDRGGFLTSQEQALAKKVDKVIPSTPNTVVKFADASGALKGTTITVRDDNGYVGVGTTTPQQPFVVSLNGAQGIEFGPDTYGSAPGFVAVDRVAGIFIQLAFFAANHKWLIGGTEKMELTATGLAVVDKVTVADDAYSASWDGNFSVPTKNAVYDKIQTLGSGGGSGSGALVVIQEIVLAADTATLDLTAIPSTYRDLVVVVNGRTTKAAAYDDVYLTLNGDTGANYDDQGADSNGNTTPLEFEEIGLTKAHVGWFPAATNPSANNSSHLKIEFPNYAATVFHKTWLNETQVKLADVGSTQRWQRTEAGWWRNTAAISRITLTPGGSNFKAGTVITLYGRGGVGSSSTTLVAVRAYNDGAQAIPNNASTAVTFNTNAFDSNSVHSTATNPSRFTVPVGLGGKWRISYKVCFAANATGVRISFLRKNGVDDTHNIIGSAVFMPPNGTLNTTNTTTITENLVAGDYVELFIYQTSGGALNVGNAIATDRGFTTTMEMEYLGT